MKCCTGKQLNASRWDGNFVKTTDIFSRDYSVLYMVAYYFQKLNDSLKCSENQDPPFTNPSFYQNHTCLHLGGWGATHSRSHPINWQTTTGHSNPPGSLCWASRKCSLLCGLWTPLVRPSSQHPANQCSSVSSPSSIQPAPSQPNIDPSNPIGPSLQTKNTHTRPKKRSL